MSETGAEAGLVRLTQNVPVGKSRSWHYQWTQDGRLKKLAMTMPADWEPMASPDGLAVALRAKGGAWPILVDADLACIDLNEGEKAAFARAAAQKIAGGLTKP